MVLRVRLVLEREPEFYGNARAVYTDDEALRVFQTAGVADEIHRDMNVDSAVRWITADGTVLVQFREPSRPPVCGGPSPTSLSALPRDHTGTTPKADTRTSPSAAHAKRVTGFTDTGPMWPSITHRLRGRRLQPAHGLVDTTKTEQVTASYLIGADGAADVVRTALGIDMTGKSYPERWLVVDLKAKQRSRCVQTLPISTSYVIRRCRRSAVPARRTPPIPSSPSPTTTTNNTSNRCHRTKAHLPVCRHRSSGGEAAARVHVQRCRRRSLAPGPDSAGPVTPHT